MDVKKSIISQISKILDEDVAPMGTLPERFSCSNSDSSELVSFLAVYPSQSGFPISCAGFKNGKRDVSLDFYIPLSDLQNLFNAGVFYPNFDRYKRDTTDIYERPRQRQRAARN